MDVIPRKTLEASPQVLEFDTLVVGHNSGAKYVTVSNTGNRPIKIKAIRKAGDINISNNAPAVLRPGQSFQITVYFVPSTEGARRASIYIDTDNAVGIEYVSITGFGYLDGVEALTLKAFAEELVAIKARLTALENS